MIYKIMPSKWSGNVIAPPSKSCAHRAIICASLADGNSVIKNVALSKDISATIDVVQKLGAMVEVFADSATSDKHDCSAYETVSISINGKNMLKTYDRQLLDCGESGSTLRFLIPVALLTGKDVAFTGGGKLLDRPLDCYYDAFSGKGIANQKTDNKLVFSGMLKSGTYKIPGNVSSQFISGLMFALPFCGDSKIEITSQLESKGYVDLTIDMLNRFGIDIAKGNGVYTIAKQQYSPSSYTVEGDYSQAAFFLVAAALGNNVSVGGLNFNSLQGDMEILDILRRVGAVVKIAGDEVFVQAESLNTIDIDASQIPDLVPILTVLACGCKGTTRIYNAGRLRIKESDRLDSISTELNKLGAKIRVAQDSLIIEGVKKLHGGNCYCHNDHRIAMSLAVASTISDGEIVLDGAECVAKSLPGFWEQISKLGAKIV